jgi:hypothetical protein
MDLRQSEKLSFFRRQAKKSAFQRREGRLYMSEIKSGKTSKKFSLSSTS